MPNINCLIGESASVYSLSSNTIIGKDDKIKFPAPGDRVKGQGYVI